MKQLPLSRGPSPWIPAFAGMTAGGYGSDGCAKVSLLRNDGCATVSVYPRTFVLRRGLRTVRGKRSLRRRDSRYRRQPTREGAPPPGAVSAAGCGSAATAISPDGRRWSDARDSREGSHARQPTAPGHQPISSRRQSCRHRGLTGFEGHAYNADVLSVYPRRLRLSETGNCGLDLPFSQRGGEGVARALAELQQETFA